MVVHLTHLRIQGFKSFADPAELAILPGLTGIVGPNGCGKSNVADALRWDLGAQFRSWAWSPSLRCSQRMRWNTGMPRPVIRFSTEQATLASVFWAGRVRARRLLPMMAL